MTEEWFEDELPWLGPPPQLPPRRDRPRPAPIGPTPPRRRVAANAAAAMPYPVMGTPPLRRPVAPVPPSVRVPQRRYGEVVALTWAGVAMILVAVLAAFALIARDTRSSPDPAPPPVSQLVIPAVTGPSSGDSAVAIVANPALQGKIICLDAAHGGIDRGFRRTGDSIAPAMDEALYTAAYARELANTLQAMGFTVVLTRDGDVVRNAQFQDVNRDGHTRERAETDADAQHNALLDEMQARIDYCNDAKADVLVSLHFDGSSDPNASGFSTWYADGREDSEQSQRLAVLIDQQLTATLGSSGYPTADGGAHPESVAALRGDQMVYDSLFMITGIRTGLKSPSRMPGVVTDLLTISNTSDAHLLASESGREAIVDALATAIEAYFTETTAQG